MAARRVNPLAHYVRRGAIERRNPSPLFDVAYYLDSNPDVAAAGAEPLRHFLAFGAAEGRNPNPFFDCVDHRAQTGPGDDGINPLVHFATTGWRTGARPSAAFDPGVLPSHVPRTFAAAARTRWRISSSTGTPTAAARSARCRRLEP